MKKFKCHVCGTREKSQIAIDVYHRGCRLSQILNFRIGFTIGVAGILAVISILLILKDFITLRG